MLTAKLVVNKQDRQRLMQAIQAARGSWRTYGPYLDWLAAQLKEAHVCEPADVPANVVTMNSQVELEDLRTGGTEVVTLVYPDERDSGGKAVSVFEPTGLSLLGSRVGDVVEWSGPDHARLGRVRDLRYQPEAAGDLHL